MLVTPYSVNSSWTTQTTTIKKIKIKIKVLLTFDHRLPIFIRTRKNTAQAIASSPTCEWMYRCARSLRESMHLALSYHQSRKQNAQSGKSTYSSFVDCRYLCMRHNSHLTSSCVLHVIMTGTLPGTYLHRPLSISFQTQYEARAHAVQFSVCLVNGAHRLLGFDSLRTCGHCCRIILESDLERRFMVVAANAALPRLCTDLGQKLLQHSGPGCHRRGMHCSLRRCDPSRVRGLHRQRGPGRGGEGGGDRRRGGARRGEVVNNFDRAAGKKMMNCSTANKYRSTLRARADVMVVFVLNPPMDPTKKTSHLSYK